MEEMQEQENEVLAGSLNGMRVPRRVSNEATVRVSIDAEEMSDALEELREEAEKIRADAELRISDLEAEAIGSVAHKLHKTAVAKGWWPESNDRDFGSLIANLHGEVSELWEAYRDGELLADSEKAREVGELSYLEEEVADIVIRALDLFQGVKYGRTNVEGPVPGDIFATLPRILRIGRAVQTKQEINLERSHRHGGKLA